MSVPVLPPRPKVKWVPKDRQDVTFSLSDAAVMKHIKTRRPSTYSADIVLNAAFIVAPTTESKEQAEYVVIDTPFELVLRKQTGDLAFYQNECHYGEWESMTFLKGARLEPSAQYPKEPQVFFYHYPARTAWEAVIRMPLTIEASRVRLIVHQTGRNGNLEISPVHIRKRGSKNPRPRPRVSRKRPPLDPNLAWRPPPPPQPAYSRSVLSSSSVPPPLLPPAPPAKN